jgi:hypothetical protein
MANEPRVNQSATDHADCWNGDSGTLPLEALTPMVTIAPF